MRGKPPQASRGGLKKLIGTSDKFIMLFRFIKVLNTNRIVPEKRPALFFVLLRAFAVRKVVFLSLVCFSVFAENKSGGTLSGRQDKYQEKPGPALKNLSPRRWQSNRRVKKQGFLQRKEEGVKSQRGDSKVSPPAGCETAARSFKSFKSCGFKEDKKH